MLGEALKIGEAVSRAALAFQKAETAHHKATSLVYQLVTSFYAGYQLVRRYQLVTRLVFGLVTGI